MAQSAGMSKLLAMISLLWTGIILLAYVGIMAQNDGWHHKWTLYYQIDVGLFSVHLQKGVGAHAAGAILAKVSPDMAAHFDSLLEREFSIQDFAEYMCTLQWPGFYGCGAGTRLKFASWGLIFCLTLSIMMHALALGFSYFYHFKEARHVTRQWLWIFQLVGPVAALVGLLGYGIGTSDLDSLPPSTGESSGTAGVLFTMAIWVTVMSIAPLIITSCIGSTLEEVRNEGIATLNKFGLGDSGKMYGANAQSNVPLSQNELGAMQQQAYFQQGNFQQPQQQYYAGTPDMYSGAQQYMAQPQQQQFVGAEYGAQQQGYGNLEYVAHLQQQLEPAVAVSGGLAPMQEQQQAPMHGAAF